MGDKVNKDSKGNVFWHCPGCDCAHRVTDGWNFNDDLEKPTISPSVLNHQPWKKDGPTCHCFVENGQIRFLKDCTHELAGKTVDMVDWQ